MFKKSFAAAAVAAILTGTAAAQDAKTVIDNAARAIGADSVKSVQYSATGFDFAFGQAPNPTSAWPKFIDKSYVRVIDFEAPATYLERVRLQGESPPRGGGGQPLVGEQSQKQTVVVGTNTPWAQQLEIWITPYGFLRAAAARESTVATRTLGGKKYTVVTFTGGNNAKVNGYINAQNEIERVETWIDTPVLGDTPFEARYSDYQEVSGVRFPRHIVQIEGGHPVLDLNVSDVKFNAAANINAPQTVEAANPPAHSEKLGEGVYLITGGYAVIAVDFKDHITVFESGQSDARAAAVIAEAKRLIPGKPIRYVVNTHSHFDHSGGLRTFVAEGATILTYRLNKAYLEKVLSQPRTLNSDAAQRTGESSGRKPVVQAVGEKQVLTDGTHVVELYHLKDFLHHDGMLVAYFPKEKLLFEADAYNPQPLSATAPNPANPLNLSLLDNIQRLHLDVQRVIPVHYPADNRVVTLNEVERWAGQSGS